MKNFFIAIFIILVVVAVAAFAGYNWYTNIISSPASSSADTVEVKILEGDNLNTISKTLEEKGLIKSELALKIYLRVNNLSPNIKTGTFLIPKNLKFEELIKKLETGVFKASVSVTLREALRPEQIASAVETELTKLGGTVKFSKSEYIDISQNPSNYTFSDKVEQFLNDNKPLDKPLIGFLFPDTYSIDADTTAIMFVNTQIENLIARLKENNVSTSHSTPETPTFYDGLILASIIEKESGASDDRQLISSVFHNRLADGIPLQSDATINFFTLRDDPRSTTEETQIDNPYNTYMYAGLTPTPINNPGVASIYAALYPKDSNYYYFRHDAEANIYFSQTYEEHQNSIYLHP